MATTIPELEWRIQGDRLYSGPPPWRLVDGDGTLDLTFNPSAIRGMAIILALLTALFLALGFFTGNLTLMTALSIPLLCLASLIVVILYERECRAGCWIHCDLTAGTVEFARAKLTVPLDRIVLWQIVLGEWYDRQSVSELNAILKDGDDIWTVPLIGGLAEAVVPVGRALERKTGIPCEVRCGTEKS